MKIEYSYLTDQFKNSENILKDIALLVKSGDFTLGKPVREFEEQFAKLLGASFAIGVNSGTDAIFLSLKALGIGTGDEVITAPNTFIATVGAIVAAGAKPVFADVLDDYTIDPERIRKAVTSRTRAIIPVHYAGHPADMTQIMDIARQHHLHVIEDACQAVLAEFDGQCAGTIGITGCFSFHPLKNLNVWGDAGMIVTHSSEIRDKLNLLRNHGLKNRDEVQIFGYNSRLDSMQAIVGLHEIRQSGEITTRKITCAQRLDKGLSDLENRVHIPERKNNRKYVHHLYILQVKDRDGLMAFLTENGIEAKIHYPIPLHLQKAADYLGYHEGDFPVTEAQAKSMITLPCHQYLTDTQIDYMIKKIHEFYE